MFVDLIEPFNINLIPHSNYKMYLFYIFYQTFLNEEHQNRHVMLLLLELTEVILKSVMTVALKQRKSVLRRSRVNCPGREVRKELAISSKSEMIVIRICIPITCST